MPGLRSANWAQATKGVFLPEREETYSLNNYGAFLLALRQYVASQQQFRRASILDCVASHGQLVKRCLCLTDQTAFLSRHREYPVGQPGRMLNVAALKD
jgi:hypothetical protein